MEIEARKKPGNGTVCGVTHGINGPILTVIGGTYQMSEMVWAGESRLTGEVIRLEENRTIVQAFEDTTGLKPGEPVIGTGNPISVLLGPGLLGHIFDGIQRPLKTMGPFMPRGIYRSLGWLKTLDC